MLSVIILTKNEEDVIADCLESIRGLAEEVVVVDSESTDRTPDIARKLGAVVHVRPFQNFSDQRNYAMSRAHGHWVLYLDADEHATPEFIREVKTVISNHQVESDINGYFIRRKTFYYGKDWGLTDQVQRLFLKKNFVEWYGVVHETPRVKGRFGIINAPVQHFTHRNLIQMVEKTNFWSEYEADLRFKAKHPQMSTLRFIRVMLTGFIKSYVFEKGYKNGTEGFIEATYQAFSMFITYAKLWEKQTKKNHG